jgi:hypothetical protein
MREIGSGCEIHSAREETLDLLQQHDVYGRPFAFIFTPPSPAASALSTLRETSLLVEDLATAPKPVPAVPSQTTVFVEATPGVCVCVHV